MKTELLLRKTNFKSEIKDSISPSDPGPEPELLWLSPKDIVIDRSYQREVDSTHAQRILAAFKWSFFQAITVTRETDGTYIAIDGQHRVVAARNHPSVTKVPCVVVETANVEEQAQGFLAVNSNRKAITPIEIYYAALTARDPLHVAIAEMLDEIGIVVHSQSGYRILPPNKTVAIGSIKRLYRHHGRIPVEKCLRAIKSAWPDQPGTFTSSMITANVQLFIDDDNLSVEDVAQAMGESSPIDLLVEAQVLGNTDGIRVYQAIRYIVSDRMVRIRRRALHVARKSN